MAGEWLAQLPENLKANEILTSHATLGDFANAHIATVGKVSELDGKVKESDGKVTDLTKRLENALFVPGEKATDAERASFYTKLGRPETADKYSITKPADLPEGIQYSPEVETAFKQIAYESGLSDGQAGKLYGWYYGLVKAGHAQQAKAEKDATEAAVNKLKDEWKGDAFKVNSELAARAFKKFGGDSPEVAKFITETKVNGVALGDHPVFLKVFHAIAKSVSDDFLVAGGRGGAGGETSDEEKAKARFPATYKK